MTAKQGEEQVIMTECEITTYAVPADALSWLNDKFAKSAKRAAKLNVEAPTYEIVGEETKIVDELTGEIETLKMIVVHGVAPKLDGWQLIAALDVLEGGVLVRVVPNVELTDVERERAQSASNECDHCMTKRQRKSTYVLRHDDGRSVIVGSTCLQDFLGGQSPERIVGWAQIILELLAELSNRESYGYGGERAFGVTEYLLHVAAAIEQWGWVSAKQAWDTGEQSTASRVWDVITGGTSKDAKLDREILWNALLPSTREHFVEIVENTLVWASEGDDSNDYRHNVKIACSSPVVAKTHKLAASAVSSYQRDVERANERAAREAAEADLPLVDAPLGRQQIVGKVIARKTSESKWGISQRITLIVEHDGGCYKVNCTEPSAITTDVGDVVQLTATLELPEDAESKSFVFGKRPSKASIIAEAAVAS